MHVAVAGVHVQSDEDAPVQHAPVHGVAGGEDRGRGGADEEMLELGAQLLFPADADAVVLKPLEYRARGAFGELAPSASSCARTGPNGASSASRSPSQRARTRAMSARASSRRSGSGLSAPPESAPEK
jgi:hypothetical protein